MIRSPYLNWHHVDLRRHLELHINLPLFVDNDANAAALAEVYLGSAIQCNSLLYVLINRGVGAGIVTHNRIWRGAYGTAGEVGVLLNSPGAIKSGGSRQAIALLAIEPITIPIAIGTQYPKSQHGSSVL